MPSKKKRVHRNTKARRPAAARLHRKKSPARAKARTSLPAATTQPVSNGRSWQVTAAGRQSVPLEGKVVLITGAARRVGAQIARTLQSAGANVMIHHHTSSDEARALESELNTQRGGSAALVRADLLDTAKLGDIIATTVKTFGQLDVLINNASTFYPTPVGEITEAHWNDLLGTNLKAPLFLAQAAAPALRLTHGLVLNIADIHGMRPLRRYTTYSVAKAGLIMLTKSLARELGPQVRVNAIAPGPVMWPQDRADRALQRKIIDRTQLKRPGSPQDVARTALFLCAEAPYVTGQILAVDGGRSVGW
jgi:pteridine reductase